MSFGQYGAVFTKPILYTNKYYVVFSNEALRREWITINIQLTGNAIRHPFGFSGSH